MIFLDEQRIHFRTTGWAKNHFFSPNLYCQVIVTCFILALCCARYFPSFPAKILWIFCRLCMSLRQRFPLQVKYVSFADRKNNYSQNFLKEYQYQYRTYVNKLTMAQAADLKTFLPDPDQTKNNSSSGNKLLVPTGSRFTTLIYSSFNFY